MKNYSQTASEVLIFIFILSLAVACINNSNETILKIGEGTLAVPGGKIWYKISGTGKSTPLVLLHGGPGYSSFYLKAFEKLGDDRMVIRYDQSGGGKSTLNSDTTLYTIDHFINELDSLRNYLGIKRWHILGHSWGSIPAIEYYRAYPQYVASLIIGSLCIDAPLWEKSTRQLLATLGDSLYKAVVSADTTGKYDNPLYQKAMEVFYRKFVWRNPIKEDMDSMIATANMDIYKYMWGPSEFTINGTLKNYNISYFLPEIKIPTLFTVGEFDEILPEMVEGLADKVPGSSYIMFPGSGHMTPWDARDENVKVVRDFLNSVDSR